MLTRTDIQLDLLSKLNELCEKANVKYVLHGHGAVLAYTNQPFEEINSLEVLMCQGDAEKIAELLDDDKYYFEDSRNNPKFNKQYMMFGYKNSIDIKYNDLDFNKTRHIKNHCIRISIIFIEKPRTKNTRKVLKFNQKLLKVNNIETKTNQNNVLKKQKMSNYFFTVVRPGFYNKIMYTFKKKNISINTWDDIKKYPAVKISTKKPIKSEIFDSISTVDIDGMTSFVLNDFDEYAKHFYGKNWENKKWPAVTSHSSSLVSWEEYSQDLDVQKNFDNIQKNYEITYDRVAKTADSRVLIKEMRTQVYQSERVVHNRQHYLENKEEVMKIYQNGDLDELKEALNPLIYSMKKGIKCGYTYSVDEDIDNVLDSFLRQTNRSSLADKIIKYRIDI